MVLRTLLGTVQLLFLSFMICSSLWADAENDLIDLRRKTSAELVEKGETLFVKFCAHCHGLDGDGDGFNAEFLDKEPAELSHEKFQAKKTNHQIFRTIYKGGAGVRKSHLMPVFGHTLSEEEIWALVAYIRTLGEGEPQPVVLPTEVESERPLKDPLSSGNLQSFRKWMQEEGKKESSLKAGEKLFRKKKSCFACHQLEEEGGRIGPDLSMAGFHYKPEWVYAWIMNPQAYKLETKMPNIGINLKDARLIAAYLNELQGEGETFSKENEKFLKASGNAEKGKKLFFDSKGKVYCSKCHRVDGKGGTVGPALDYIGTRRSSEFLLESILDPKAVITSGYSTVLILTKKRKFLTGIKRFEDDSGIGIVNKEGKDLFIKKEQIKKYKTQKISMMPGNFKELLEVQEVADLLAYLKSLTLPEFTAQAVESK